MDSMTKGEKSYMTEGFSREAMDEPVTEYGPCDCYCDCMTAFHWECNEAAECASACGVSANSE